MSSAKAKSFGQLIASKKSQGYLTAWESDIYLHFLKCAESQIHYSREQHTFKTSKLMKFKYILKKRAIYIFTRF